MNRKIIVTGAAGFIGRNVVAELNARGQTDLLLVDLLGRDDKWKNLRGLKYEDLISPDELLALVGRNALNNIEALIHLGACSSTTEKDADFLLGNNYRYTRTLCEWSLPKQVRFIYASSAATYGDGSRGYQDDEASLDLLRPLNMYGHSKHMFDLWARNRRLFRLIVGLKYFNVYGPCEEHKGDMRSMVSKAYDQIRQAGCVRLFKSYSPDYADGEQMRDFIYVRDAVNVTLHFLENQAVGGLFNCGSARARTWKDLAHATFSALGTEPRIEYIDMPEALRGQYQYFTEAPMAKLLQIGYARPFTSLEDGVRDYVSSYLAAADAR
ncbi:MAG: ADP-glyceromanno-heptose 6-epimerase [Steroidobacterales bacterium]